MEDDNLLLYTDIKFQNDDISVTLKNIDLEMFKVLNDKLSIITNIIDYQWYMYGLYDIINLCGYNFTIVSKTKTKVELIRSN